MQCTSATEKRNSFINQDPESYPCLLSVAQRQRLFDNYPDPLHTDRNIVLYWRASIQTASESREIDFLNPSASLYAVPLDSNASVAVSHHTTAFPIDSTRLGSARGRRHIQVRKKCPVPIAPIPDLDCQVSHWSTPQHVSRSPEKG